MRVAVVFHLNVRVRCSSWSDFVTLFPMENWSRQAAATHRWGWIVGMRDRLRIVQSTVETTVVAIVDDHPLVRDALSAVLKESLPLVEIVAAGSIATLAQSLECSKREPDIVLLDLNLGKGCDFANLSWLVRQWPGVPVSVFSGTDEPEIIATARDLGAAGFISKTERLSAVTEAVPCLIAGEFVFPEELPCGRNTVSAAGRKLASLTPTQAKVFDGLRRGLVNKQIAHELNISLSTTKAHITAIFRKLGVTNRTQALLVAQDLMVLRR